MNNFDEKIKEILTEITEDYWEHMTCSDACGKKTMETENLKNYIAQIKQLISETIGEGKSVEELVIPDAMTDLASKVCFKEGYNTKLKELRHAFNLKDS